jgi:hypothetical protein
MLHIIYSLGQKIVDNCSGATSGGFSDYIKSDCFWFVVALLAATVIEAVGLDFLFTGTSSHTPTHYHQGQTTHPSLEDVVGSETSQPETTLSEIWASEGSDNLNLKDVIE